MFRHRILKEHLREWTASWNHINVKLSNKPSNTLKKQLNNVKDKRTAVDKIEVVYQINCQNWESVYIGEIRKQAIERVKEHKLTIRAQNKISLIFKHIEDLNYEIDFDNVKILCHNNQVRPRRLLEAFHTENNVHSINRSVVQVGKSLSNKLGPEEFLYTYSLKKIYIYILII